MNEPQTEVVDSSAEYNQMSSANPFEGAAALAPQPRETAVSAIATQARAMVEARFVMAMHRPRDLDTVRVRLLKECRRPGFADAARYRRPAGREQDDRGEWVDKIIEGPSIRFAEAAIRNMGNLDVQSPTIYDDDDKRIVRVSVTDLETNATYSRDITLEKLAEQKKLRKGQKAVGTRTNSYGDTVYLVTATESQLKLKQDSEISKSIRTLGLRLLPGDILDECMRLCIATKDAGIRADPDGARKRMIDGFAELGVSPDELKAYIGHDIGSCSPVEIGELRDLYLAIKDGITTWGEVKRARAEAEQQDAEDAGDSRIEQLRKSVKGHADQVKAKREADAAAAAQQAQPSQQQQPQPAAAAAQPEPAGAKRGR
jgi:hypothetical protein